MLYAIIPDPHFVSGQCRKEVYGDNPEQLAAAAREWIHLDAGYGASDIGSLFNVFRDGNIVGTLRYNGRFDWRDPAYAEGGAE